MAFDDLTDEELEIEIQKLSAQREEIREQQKTMHEELDERLKLERRARALAELPEDVLASLPAPDPRVVERMGKWADFKTSQE